MAKADWTYQVAAAGAPASGLDEYVVQTAGGDDVGKVQTLLRRGDELWLAVERGTPPLTHDVRVFAWRDVGSVDHAGLTVRLAPHADADAAIELDPDKGVENGEAEAVRVTELPPELRPSSSPADPGPVDRPSTALALSLGALGVFALLVLVVAATVVDFDWEFGLFAIPLALLLASGVVAYRLFRSPYERA